MYGRPLRVLVWNLKHGRSVPGAGRELLDEFADALAAWEWDVGLLQEVPPWWGPVLGRRLGATVRIVLTSRNELPALRRALARRWPDVVKSAGGGCNAILVRDGPAVLEHRRRLLRRFPERRWVHGVRLSSGVWAANLHAGGSRPEALRARTSALAWAAAAPVVLGGDFNIHNLELESFVHAGGRYGDHVFLRGLRVTSQLEVLDAGHLSDHAPLRVAID